MAATLSVLTPNFNHARYIGQAIQAVVSQSRPPDQYIIVDDASTDDSLKIIQSYADRYPYLRLLRNERNLGTVQTMARAVQAATGTHLLTSAADDYLLPGFLQQAMTMAEEYPQAGIIFSGVEFLHVDGRLGDVTGGFNWRQWKSSFYMAPKEFMAGYVELEHPGKSLSAATLWQARALAEVGGFRQELETWSDTFALRAMGLRHGACFVAGAGCVFRLSPDSCSSVAVDNPKRMLDVMARATRLMRSPEFRDVFPEDHIRSWEKTWRHWLVEHVCHRVNASYVRAGEGYLNALKFDRPIFFKVGQGLMKFTGLFRRAQIWWLKQALKRYPGETEWRPTHHG